MLSLRDVSPRRAQIPVFTPSATPWHALPRLSMYIRNTEVDKIKNCIPKTTLQPELSTCLESENAMRSVRLRRQRVGSDSFFDKAG